MSDSFVNITVAPIAIKASPGVVDIEKGRRRIVGHIKSISSPTITVPKQKPSHAIPMDHPMNKIAPPAIMDTKP